MADAIREGAPGVSQGKVRVVLSFLNELGVVGEARGARFRLRQPGIDAARLGTIAGAYPQRTDTDRAKSNGW